MSDEALSRRNYSPVSRRSAYEKLSFRLKRRTAELRRSPSRFDGANKRDPTSVLRGTRYLISRRFSENRGCASFSLSFHPARLRFRFPSVSANRRNVVQFLVLPSLVFDVAQTRCARAREGLYFSVLSVLNFSRCFIFSSFPFTK